MRDAPDDVLAALRHRKASSDPGSYWEYDPPRGILFGRVRLASAAIALDYLPPGRDQPGTWLDLPDDVGADHRVRLCSERAPREAAYALRDLGEAFVVSPARYFRVRGRFVPEPIHPDLPLGSLLLTNAPDDVAAELRALFLPRGVR